jgi:hypothetical protein
VLNPVLKHPQYGGAVLTALNGRRNGALAATEG